MKSPTKISHVTQIYNVDVVVWHMFGNYSIPMREVFVTSIL